VSTGDDPSWIGDYSAVVKEHVHVVAGSQKSTDVSFQHEVWLNLPLDRLFNLRICLMDKIANLLADLLLPGRKRIDVVVYTRISVVGQRSPSLKLRFGLDLYSPASV
jgi:hypothetical protein